MIIYNIKDLSIQLSSGNLKWCQIPDELRKALERSHLPAPTLACYSDQIGVIDQMASNRLIDHIYIIKNTAEIMKLTKVDRDNITIVNNKEELMRHLYMKNMCCLIIDALKHKQAGDMALMNRSLEDARKSLHCA
jgi:hypothetical protein